MQTTLTINGTPVHHTPLTTPEAYAATWRPRERNARVRCGYFSLYASTYIETDQGAEIEVSALVDLIPGRAEIDDLRFRLVDGPEVEIDERLIDGEVRDRLVDAAMQAAREVA